MLLMRMRSTLPHLLASAVLRSTVSSRACHSCSLVRTVVARSQIDPSRPLAQLDWCPASDKGRGTSL